MPLYTFDSALQAMKNNSAIQAICYKMETRGTDLFSFVLEREDQFFWHQCEMLPQGTSSPILLWKKLVLPPLLPPPCQPLVRQVATGYLSPTAQTLTITIPGSCFNSPESGALGPRPSPKTPLALSRQSSVALEEATGICENTHLFFDEDGNEISKEEATEFSIEFTHEKPHIFRHPRVLLFYLRYVAAANELEETPSWPVLTEEHRKKLHTYIFRHPPPPEFEEDVKELFALVEMCPA